jgi:hypothetical protein
MLYLIDTGVLLRLFNRADASHLAIRRCLRELKMAGHRLAVSPQNIAEFWNVSTRPETARGGYGLSVEGTHHESMPLPFAVPEKFCQSDFTRIPTEAQGHHPLRSGPVPCLGYGGTHLRV